jgi:hypothetical protein
LAGGGGFSCEKEGQTETQIRKAETMGGTSRVFMPTFVTEATED